MTFLDPGAEQRPKKQTEDHESFAPWTIRRAAILGLPFIALSVASSSAWFWLSAALVTWHVPAACAAAAVISIAWSVRAIRKGELRAIDIWQAIAGSMPDADKRRYGIRLDSYFVGARGGVVVIVSPPPPLDQAGLDKVGHKAATARMLRAEPVEIVKNPRRLRRGYSVRFGFVPK